jgi:hypothetical protein
VLVQQLGNAACCGGKAVAKGREAGKGGHAGEASLNTSHECRPAGGRACCCPKDDTQKSGLADNPQVVHNGREPSRHFTNGEKGVLAGLRRCQWQHQRYRWLPERRAQHRGRAAVLRHPQHT